MLNPDRVRRLKPIAASLSSPGFWLFAGQSGLAARAHALHAGVMTQTEQLMEDLRKAISAELVEAARQWWTESGASYIEAGDVDGAIDDLLITMEQA